MEYVQEYWLEFTIYFLLVNIIVLAISAAVIVWLPHDYLLQKPPYRKFWVRVVRDTVGSIMLVAGLLMLVAPGPGMLTVICGLIIMDGEEKRKMLRKICQRESLAKTIQNIRKMANKQPLRIDEEV